MAYVFPRCQIVPLPEQQVAFQLDGTERLRWHYGTAHPRPFFYPLLSAGGHPLTRMGHPGAPDHDHHCSIWFAHHKVLGIDFWSDRSEARVRQKQWVVYQDGDDEATMCVRLGWYDGHEPQELFEQELIAGVRPGPAEGEVQLELQSTFRPTAQSLEFGQTNFGFLAVRVAKSLSAHFGGGTLTNSAGEINEPAIFGKPATWMDYSGPLPDGDAGITYFDHPSNPGHPVGWHVREDGWMGASACMHGPLETTRLQPLTLRYLLHAHAGALEPARANQLFADFASRPAYALVKSQVKHTQLAIQRVT